jgi:hypothetical protein
METLIGLLLAEISDVIRHPKELIYTVVLIYLWFWLIWPALLQFDRVLNKLEKKLDLDLEGK